MKEEEARLSREDSGIETKPLKRHLKKLRPFMLDVSTEKLNDNERLSACVRASLIKAYEFCAFAHNHLKNDFAFHCVGGLRSICEDLIILKFISSLSAEDQKILLTANMISNNHKGLHFQAKFFDTFRAGQPILRGAYSAETLQKLDSQVNSIWQQNGWPKSRGGNWPPTEQIARKIGEGVVDVLYDYIFRLTSSTVHLNTLALFRMGWGNLTSKGLDEVRYSTKNMGNYYLAFCQIYGVFLLSIYFEFFSDILNVPSATQKKVQQLRIALVKENRWPEMVTFEEMNEPKPKFQNLIGVVLRELKLSEEFKDGFILGSEKAKATVQDCASDQRT